jgi:hypothetical protein
VNCGGPCYRQGPYGAWHCETCEHAHRHEHRKWTKRTVKAALVRWADDLGRPPTAQETALPGTRVPYRAIQREFSSLSNALNAAELPTREPGQRAGTNGCPDRAKRPWADGWLHERFYTRDRRRKPNHRLPALEVKLGYPPLTAAQQRELRAQWLAARAPRRPIRHLGQSARAVPQRGALVSGQRASRVSDIRSFVAEVMRELAARSLLKEPDVASSGRHVA